MPIGGAGRELLARWDGPCASLPRDLLRACEVARGTGAFKKGCVVWAVLRGRARHCTQHQQAEVSVRPSAPATSGLS